MSPRGLPERFHKADPDEVCPDCDKHRKLCIDCERCSEHCECPEVCERCGGLHGVTAVEVAHIRGMDICWCLPCVICHKMINQDDADFGYGLTEEQTEQNTGCSATAVCESCVAKKKTPPPFEERRFQL